MQFLRNILFVFIFIFFGNVSASSQNLSLVFGDYSGEMGDIVCVDLTVANFEGVSSMEWRTRFDPAVLRFDTIDLTTSVLNEGIGGDNLLSLGDFNIFQGESGYITIAWANGPPEGVTLNDGDILYTLCFEIIGEPCESSILATNGNPNSITITIAEPLTGNDITLPEDEIDLITGSVTVDPDGLFISESHCSSEDNDDTGSITFAGSGGNGPYSWTLMGPGGTNEAGSGLNDCETEVVDDLGPGTYTLIITDSNNVTRNESITIQSSSTFPFVLTLDGIDPTCFNKDNGSVFIDNIQGGEGSFTYEWSNQNFIDDNITKLETGEYALTITDENGCSTSASYNLVADTVKVDVVVVSDPSCDGSMDGIISFTGSGGTPYSNGGYNYDVDGIDTTFYIGNANQLPGSYSPANFFEGCFSVRVIDSLGCPSDTTQFCLEAGSFSTLTLDTVDVSCFGECDGSILITAANIGNFVFQVTDEFGAPLAGAINDATTYQAQNLCPGVYMATVTDNADGCFIDTVFTIGEPLLLEMSIDSIGPGCSGGDGMVTLSGIGGTMPYEFLWDDNDDQPIRNNMEGGTYSVTITDANGCQDDISWTFGEGGSIGLNAGVLNAVSCESTADGSVRATVTDPGSFTFTWEDDNGMFIGNGNIIENLSGGIYSVTASDGSCEDTATVILAPGQTPAATVAMVSPSCSNSDDGMLTATLLEGVAPANFEWNMPPSNAVISSGPIVIGEAGIYNLHIVDDNGCESDELFEILPSPDSIRIDITNITENFCFGDCTAGATFTASGGPAGTGDYTFIINGSPVVATSAMHTSTNLCAGTNYILALDGICFTDTIFFNIEDTDEIMIDELASTITPPTCSGDTDGSISAVVIGGNSSNYDLLWLNEGISGTDLSNLTAGQYILQITDANNCIVTDTVDLITPDPLTVDIDPFITSEMVCASGAVGMIGLNTSGGNPGQLTYDWIPDVSSSAIAEDLAPGTYSVTVSDINGCTDFISYDLTSAPPIILDIPTPAEPDCFGGTTVMCLGSVTGGVDTNYTYAIQNGPSLPIDSCFTLFAGEYSVKVFDSSGPGCAFDTTLIIEQPSQITVDVGEDLTIDLGSTTDPVSAFIVSELDIDSISWSPDINVECNTIDCQIVSFSPDATTTYTVTVTDENGCLATDDIQVVVDLTRNVYTPNIFSPNSDNQNDHFQLITGNGVTMVNYLKIYDRWGNLVYTDESYIPNDTEHIGWDGTRDGTENEPGVYVFFAEVEFIDGVSIIYKGDVTLVR